MLSTGSHFTTHLSDFESRKSSSTKAVCVAQGWGTDKCSVVPSIMTEFLWAWRQSYQAVTTSHHLSWAVPGLALELAPNPNSSFVLQIPLVSLCKSCLRVSYRYKAYAKHVVRGQPRKPWYLNQVFALGIVFLEALFRLL